MIEIHVTHLRESEGDVAFTFAQCELDLKGGSTWTDVFWNFTFTFNDSGQYKLMLAARKCGYFTFTLILN